MDSDRSAPLRIEPISRDIDTLDLLIHESLREGWRHLERLRDEWRSGVNRFDRPGEVLYVARSDAELVGVGGLNIDPFAGDPHVGRIRRVYVCAAERRHGIGSALLRRLLGAAAGRFSEVRLLTRSAEAAAFFERMGFEAGVGVDHCTHRIRLGEGGSTK